MCPKYISIMLDSLYMKEKKIKILWTVFMEKRRKIRKITSPFTPNLIKITRKCYERTQCP